jgi:hypothetical protein
LVWPKLLDLGLHCWVLVSKSIPGPTPQSSQEEAVSWGPPLHVMGLPSSYLLQLSRLMSVTYSVLSTIHLTLGHQTVEP